MPGSGLASGRAVRETREEDAAVIREKEREVTATHTALGALTP